MILSPLCQDDVIQVGLWRNQDRAFLRTPHFLNGEMQSDFYRDVVCKRDSKHRYFAIRDAIGETIKFEADPEQNNKVLMGMAGLTNIEWENRNAEISVIIDPERMRNGYGMEAVDLILAEAFDNMGLEAVTGEVYNCGNRKFWEKVVKKHNGTTAELVHRKRWEGKMYDSMWFCIRSEGWKNI